MRESRTYGSVRGALSNERPYRDNAPSVFAEASLFMLTERLLVLAGAIQGGFAAPLFDASNRRLHGDGIIR